MYIMCIRDLLVRAADSFTSKFDDEERLRPPHCVPHAHDAITHQLPEEGAQRPYHPIAWTMRVTRSWTAMTAMTAKQATLKSEYVFIQTHPNMPSKDN